IALIPDHVCPELVYHVGKDRASPDYRSVLSGKHQINGNDLDPVFCHHRVNTVVVCLSGALQSVHLRDGMSCDIRVEDTYPEAFRRHTVGKGGCHEGLSYTAFAADYSYYMFHI